jgi:signal transduction histidine kinase
MFAAAALICVARAGDPGGGVMCEQPSQCTDSLTTATAEGVDVSFNQTSDTCHAAADTPPVSRVAEIRAYAPEQAARGIPVRITGVITYLGWENFVVHDGESSIFADFRYARRMGLWKGPEPELDALAPGAGIEVTGITDPGGFSPMVLVTGFRRLGEQPLPDPLRPSAEQLLSGSVDTQWVEVEGVVRKHDIYSNGFEWLSLIVDGHPCPVLPRNPLDEYHGRLVDARIRVRGVVLNIANLRSQVAGMKIHCNGPLDIDIIKETPADPFLAPKVAPDRLIPFDPQADTNHRKVTSGVVTFVVPGRFFYISDGSVSVRVESPATMLSPGDRVDVAGFIDTRHVLASFSEALVRVTGRAEIPDPQAVEIESILNPKVRSWEEMVSQPGHPDLSGRMIRLEGVLRRVLPRDGEDRVTLVLESGKHLVRAFLPANALPDPNATPWIEGSRLELSAVCELEIDRIDSMPWFAISGFHLWLSSPDQVRVLSIPPWWTPRRLATLLAALLAGLGLSLAWGYTMRRRVSQRSRELATQIAAGESARLEFNTILGERRRLANDLHDTLEQALTGLAMQMEISDRSRHRDPEASARHLGLARQFLERSRRELHRTVWDLRAHGLDGRCVSEVLRDRLSKMVAGSGVEVSVEVHGIQTHLPDLIAGNLLLLAQEAVTNAVKHAEPTLIRVGITFAPESIGFEIEDNGRGFDPESAAGPAEGHFGLQGIHERVKRLEGSLRIDSAPSRGTLISATIPLEPTAAAERGEPCII